MLFLTVLSIIALVQGIKFTDPVNTTQGLIRGIIAENGYYSMYLGVPYAKVNMANPFGMPLPPPQFNRMYNANVDSNICPQLEEFNNTIVGTLDCLNLNIYTPNRSLNDTKLPVLVYIYGGQFMFGFARRYLYGPKFLVEHDIILVVINYRVGPYGFMCLDTEDIPGNQGLKDQYLALKWIYENIDSFGGDANRITLSGNSAGAMSVDFHLLNDQPKFFNQAILQSGSALMPAVITPSDNTAPFRIAKYLGFTTNDIQEAISFLANIHTDLVIAAGLQLNMTFGPCVEKKFNNVDQFIDVHPEFKNISNINDIKLIAGINSNEQMPYAIEETLFPDIIMRDFNIEDMATMIDIARTFYIGDEILNQSYVYKNLLAFVSDFKYNYPIQRNIIRYIQSGLQVFQYMFSYKGNRNYGQRNKNSTENGAGHADEIGYLFDTGVYTESPSIKDQLMIDRMTTMWTNFVKFGNPTPSASDLIPVMWVPATEDVIWYLNINWDLVLESRPFHARLSFWDLFYAANQDNLLANIYYAPSSAPPFSVSFELALVCGFTIYLFQL